MERARVRPEGKLMKRNPVVRWAWRLPTITCLLLAGLVSTGQKTASRESLSDRKLVRTVPIENSELNKNMEFAHPPSSLPSGAQRTFLGYRDHGDDLQSSDRCR